MQLNNLIIQSPSARAIPRANCPICQTEAIEVQILLLNQVYILVKAIIRSLSLVTNPKHIRDSFHQIQHFADLLYGEPNGRVAV